MTIGFGPTSNNQAEALLQQAKGINEALVAWANGRIGELQARLESLLKANARTESALRELAQRAEERAKKSTERAVEAEKQAAKWRQSALDAHRQGKAAPDKAIRFYMEQIVSVIGWGDGRVVHLPALVDAIRNVVAEVAMYRKAKAAVATSERPIYGPPEAQYFGFDDRYDLFKQFEADDEGERILFASYENEGYEGDAYVLFENPATGELLEIEASHCSCNGLEGQWLPGAVTWPALAMRLQADGTVSHISRHTPEAQAYFAELVRSHLPTRASVDAALLGAR